MGRTLVQAAGVLRQGVGAPEGGEMAADVTVTDAMRRAIPAPCIPVWIVHGIWYSDCTCYPAEPRAVIRGYVAGTDIWVCSILHW